MSKPPANTSGPHEHRPAAAGGRRESPVGTIDLRDDTGSASRAPRSEGSDDATGSRDVVVTDALIRALIEESPDGIVLVDGSGRIELVNRQTEQLFGYRRADLLGEPIELLVPEELREAHRSHRAAFDNDPLSRPIGVGLELLGRRRDGSTFPVEIALTPVGAPAGSIVIATVRDISERRAAAEARLELSRLRAMAEIVSLHQRLTTAIYLGQGLAGLAQVVREVTGRTVAVEDAEGALWASAGPEPPDRSTESTLDLRRRLQEAGHARAFRDGERLVAAARPDGEVLGAISIIDPDADATEAETYALEQAATVLAMELFRLRSIAETELKVWGDLATELLDGSDLDRCRSHAHALGYDLDRPHRAVLVEQTTSPPGQLLSAVRRVARRLGLDTTLMTSRAAGVVLLLDHDLPWAEFAEAVTQQGAAAHRIGIGGRHDPKDLRRSLGEAELALRLTPARGGGAVAAFDELGVWRFLAADADPAGLQALVLHWIGPLLDYDAAHDAELIKTLVAYLEGAGALEATALRLHIHRSTLRYRLGRIRDLTGWDLRDPEQRFTLELACRAHTTLVLLRAPT